MTFDEASTIVHSLGTASKMPCFAFSTSARDCKRGGKLRSVAGSVCSKCYAHRGNFARPTIQANLKARSNAMEHPQWPEAMAFMLTAKEHSGHFRWFASGDLQSLGDLLKICDVAKRTSHIKHWLATHEVGILAAFKRAGFVYPKNLIVRLSGDMLEKKPAASLLQSLGVLGSAVSKSSYTCPASTTDNECRTCRKCWSKRTLIVTYKRH